MTLRPFLILPPIVLAVGVFVLMNRSGDAPQDMTEERALAVRVQTVAPQEITGTATGYGRAEAVRTWSAIAEVQGRVTYLPEDHAVGAIVEAGTELVRIDTTDYDLARQKAEANIAVVEDQMAELVQQEANSRAMLEVE